MLHLSAEDLTVLSKSQRKAIAAFVLSFPTNDDETSEISRPQIEAIAEFALNFPRADEEEEQEEGSTLSSVTFPEIAENDDVSPFTDEQLTAINRRLNAENWPYGVRVTDEQLDAIVRSVMARAS